MTRSTVYFADKIVTFAPETPAGEWFSVRPEADGSVHRAKITKILEKHNFVSVVTPDPEMAFKSFAAGFRLVEAAGGVVENARGEWLMIHRNGRWDLPKGHLECGESIDECAAREIEEETGVCAEVVAPLCDTYHAYRLRGQWELKHTYWYSLHAKECGGLKPQTEEGIEEVAWCNPQQVANNLRGTFPTIRCVAEIMKDPAR